MRGDEILPDNLVRLQPALPSKVRIVSFDQIKLGTQRRYTVKNLIPSVGLVLVWGPPKSGKSFFVFDLEMHVAIGREYRGRRVQQGAVVHCAFEGQAGMAARVEAFKQECLDGYEGPVPFYLQTVTLDLVRDHQELIAAIRETLGIESPSVVTLDTLNRSLHGSENSDEDMSAYVNAAAAISAAFNCAVIIVHQCGVEGSRPRGHTSLTGAVDVQIKVAKSGGGNSAQVELAKDGPEGDLIAFSLNHVEVGTDDDGEAITSCVVVPEKAARAAETGPKLTKDQQTFYTILRNARGPLLLEEWNAKAKAEGIGVHRKATLYDLRSALLSKGLIVESTSGWIVKD